MNESQHRVMKIVFTADHLCSVHEELERGAGT